MPDRSTLPSHGVTAYKARVTNRGGARFVYVERTHLSADFGFGFGFASPSRTSPRTKSNINFKSSGQECPLHINLAQLRYRYFQLKLALGTGIIRTTDDNRLRQRQQDGAAHFQLPDDRMQVALL